LRGCFGQALSGFLITAHHGAKNMCGGKNYKKIDIQKTVAAVWRQNNKTIKKMALTVCGVLHDYSGAVRV